MSGFKFPANFLWGAAASAHQVEGGNLNDWSEWEIINAARLAREADSKFSYLKNWSEIQAQAENPENYISGKTCDHYSRFRKDFDIAKQLGHNAHRFSIEWSRIEPEEGKFNEQEIEHYREVIKALRERGMEPFVTLWHWTLPLWVRDQGGWENPKTIRDFLRYTNKIIDVLGSNIHFWIPLNEPTIYVGHSYIIGDFPPQLRSYRRGNNVLKNLIQAHHGAYRLIHEQLGREVMVGNAHNLHYNVPYRQWWPPDMLATAVFRYIRDLRPLRWTRRMEDFIGLNYYFRDTVKFIFGAGRFPCIDIQNPNEWLSDMGWDLYPEGIYHSLKYLARYRKPIYIIENGLADQRDIHRTKFIGEHLKWIGRAIREGTDVRGYLHWSLLDNFEWDKGFWPRFGLVEVDYKTLERKIRPSAWEFKKIIESNAIEVPNSIVADPIEVKPR